MTDKELLSKAAKVAGAQVTDYSDRTPDHLTIKHADGIWREWNPLKDDGDALRLMVSLRQHNFDAYIGPDSVQAETWLSSFSAMLADGDDPYAALRRAIVEAAAGIAP